ncbi:hypothetical protein [Peribacillus frigoritolerans]|uniref:Uncharacterized protein n=1 Tax=Peribacillus castrilensis TaxID=2897690 RepID=A0AAW9NPG3_9BACI|nr:hypothetical protein [Peribacillus castrilensis]
MLKIIALGFEQGEIQPNENYIFAIHKPGVTEGMTNKEYYKKCRSFAEDADVILLKNKQENLAEDEVVILYSAYSNSTPIFGVGTPISSPLVGAVYSNAFLTVDDVIDHLNVHYLPQL